MGLHQSLLRDAAFLQICEDLTFVQTDQADIFKCRSIIGDLGFTSGGDDPDIGVCVQHGYLIAQIGADGSASPHLVESVQKEEILWLPITEGSLKLFLNRIEGLRRYQVQGGMILPDLANVSRDEIGFSQCPVIPIADMIRTAVELNEEWDRPVSHIAPRAAIRRKKLPLQQMLEEGCLPNATIADNGDIRVGLCAEIRQWRDSPVLPPAPRLKMADCYIPLRQQTLNDIQIVKAIAFPVGGDIIIAWLTRALSS